MSVDIIAFILCLQNLPEFFDLLFHLQQAGNLQEILLRFKRFNYITVTVFIVPVQFRAIMRYTAELFHVMNGIIRRNTHNGSHFITFSLIMR